MIKLANNNETIFGDHMGVNYEIKFHDDTTKINVSITGKIYQAFAIFGQDVVSENRKAFIAMIKGYIEARLQKEGLCN